jgi:thioesterase domain-containing protein
LPLSVLFEAPTIHQLVQIICGQKSCSSSDLVSVQPNGTRPPLFCVHGSGGEPYYCWKLSSCLGLNQPLYGLRFSDVSGEAIQHSIQDMAARYTQVIRAVQPNGPYYVGGFCFGGMVAYEMAQILISQGEEVALLALINTPAPGSIMVWPLDLNYISRKIRQDLRNLVFYGLRKKLRIVSVKSIRLARGALQYYASAVSGAIASYSNSKTRTNDRKEKHLSVSDANIAAAAVYRPGQYAGKITLFPTQECASLWAIDPVKGWLPFASGEIEQHAVDGDHDSLFELPFVATLAEKLKLCIDRTCEALQTSSLTAEGNLKEERYGVK